MPWSRPNPHASGPASSSTSTSTTARNNDSQPSFFERLKRKTQSSSSSDSSQNHHAGASSSASTSVTTSMFSLAQRLRALLDVHPVNNIQSNDATPTPAFSPLVPGSPVPQHPLSPVLSPTGLIPMPDSPHSPLSHASLLSSPAAYFSADLPSSPMSPVSPVSPADAAELVALLSSPEFMNGTPLPPLVPGMPQGHQIGIPGSPVPTPYQNDGHTSTPVPVPAAIPVHMPTPRLPTSPLGNRRQSVWNLLDRIGSPKSRARRMSRVVDEGSTPASPRPRQWTPTSPSSPLSPAMSSITSVLAAYGSDDARGVNEITEDENEDDSDEEDDTSMMLYSPLMPTPTSLVSIADSEVVSLVAAHDSESDGSEDGAERNPDPPLTDASRQHIEQGQGQGQQETKSGWGLSNIWSFTSWWGTRPETTPRGPQEASTQPRPTSPRSPRPTSQARVRRRRIWVPSRTQLSLETMWWGYRIYIPPPVLEALDSSSVETNRRAALLTAALTWFFTNFPVNVLPPTVRPVIIILQGLVPYLGYLGGLLSWSWGTIRSYDEGYGIILTATWLMPIALIPSTWVPPPPDWPGSPSSPSPAVLAPLSPGPSSQESIPGPTTPSTSPPTSPRPPIPRSTSPTAQPHQIPRAHEYQPFSLPPSPPPVEPHFQQNQQALRQRHPYPAQNDSPYSQASMLSPLPLQFGSFSVPAPNGPAYALYSPHPGQLSYIPQSPYSSYTQYGHPTSMIAPGGTNGNPVVYSPVMTQISSSNSSPISYAGTLTPTQASPPSIPTSVSYSPYSALAPTPSSSSSRALYATPRTELTPTPSSPSSLPPTSPSGSTKKKSKKRDEKDAGRDKSGTSRHHVPPVAHEQGSSSSRASYATMQAGFPPTPSSPVYAFPASPPGSTMRKSKRGDGKHGKHESLHAPRISTVPLPGDRR